MNAFVYLILGLAGDEWNILPTNAPANPPNASRIPAGMIATNTLSIRVAEAIKQALYALGQLHAKLAEKLLDSKAESHRVTVAMLQVEAVMKML